MSGNDIHVTPRADLIGHTLTEDCVCGPRTEPCTDIEGFPAGWVLVHHSLDGREGIEHIGIQENPN